MKLKWLPLLAVILPVLPTPRLCAQIRRVQPFRNDAEDAAWCGSNGKIAFERSGEIWLAHVDGGDECLTCSLASLARGANRFPEWAANGSQIAFTSGPQIVLLDLASRRVLFHPANDAQNLRIAPDGSALLWDEKAPGGRAARMAKTTQNAIWDAKPLPMPPELSLDAVDDFLRGGSILITAARGVGNPRETAIYECETAKPNCRVVAAQPGQRLDHARLTPGGSGVIFASTAGGWFAADAIDDKSDLWLAGLRTTLTGLRMTWFNEPANPNYIRDGADVTSSAWRADGRWLLATVVANARNHIRRLVKIEFPEAE